MTSVRWCGALLCAFGWASPSARGDDWPQWRGPVRDGVWRESGILTRYPPGGPKVMWRVPIGPGYCGPCVASGRLYVLDRIPDPSIERQLREPAAAGSANSKETKDAEKAAAGRRINAGVPGKERVLCIDVADGKTLWRHEYDCPYRFAYPEGPRATPICIGERVYSLGAMADLICFDAANGSIVWKKNLGSDYKAKPPVWGWASHPLVDGDLLYCVVGGDGSAVVALDRRTGEEVWRSLTVEEIGYSPPMIVEAGGQRQLIAWLDSAVYSLDLTTGKTLWSQPHPADGTPMRPVVSIIAPTRAGNGLFVSEFYKGSMMLDLDADRPGAKVRWRSNGGEPMKPGDINAIMATPLFRDGHLYGVCGHGELRCIDVQTGKVQWETLQATGGKRALFAHAFITPIGDRCFLFNDQGELIVARLTPKGFEELDRAKLLEPTFFTRGRNVVWCHPAYAEKSAFIRNDRELIRVWLGEA